MEEVDEISEHLGAGISCHCDGTHGKRHHRPTVICLSPMGKLCSQAIGSFLQPGELDQVLIDLCNRSGNPKNFFKKNVV